MKKPIQIIIHIHHIHHGLPANAPAPDAASPLSPAYLAAMVRRRNQELDEHYRISSATSIPRPRRAPCCDDRHNVTCYGA